MISLNHIKKMFRLRETFTNRIFQKFNIISKFSYQYQLKFNRRYTMGRLEGKNVLITGASAGIGEACAKEFAKAGSNLILTARRIERLEKIREEFSKNYPSVKIFTHQLDVREKEKVDQLVSFLPSDLRNIDVLVNNAGLVIGIDKVENATDEAIDTIIDTNVKGLLYVTRAIIPIMKERQKGHIINIGSISGKQVYVNGGVYCASKHAVDAISRTLLLELVDTPIRVTQISPGMVETEFSVVRFNGDKTRADKVYEGLQPLTAEDIAETIVFAASRPDHVNIADMLIYPVSQASASSVHRPLLK